MKEHIASFQKAGKSHIALDASGKVVGLIVDVTSRFRPPERQNRLEVSSRRSANVTYR